MGEATAKVVARDILNHGLRFLHKSLIERPDPLAVFCVVMDVVVVMVVVVVGGGGGGDGGDEWW